MKRTLVPLANVYNPSKHRLETRLMSIKLDGMRALWDGGLTRGLPVEQVPFANTDKDHRLLAKPIATGLWSRYGKVIHAPDSFLDNLPIGQMLDGELYTDRNQLHIVVGTAKSFQPDEVKWANINYHVFDAPTYGQFAKEGTIYETHYKKEFTPGIKQWVLDRIWKLDLKPLVPNGCTFQEVYATLRKHQDSWSDRLRLVGHFPTKDWQQFYEEELTKGGEGIMFRDMYSGWIPNRHDGLLKCKPDHDSEAIVVGWKSGRLTDLGSKLLGMMGALKVEWLDGPVSGVEFWVSGFTEGERTISHPDIVQWAIDNPDTERADGTGLLYFNLGDSIQFKYGELTADGIPRRAAYKRKRRGGDD